LLDRKDYHRKESVTGLPSRNASKRKASNLRGQSCHHDAVGKGRHMIAPGKRERSRTDKKKEKGGSAMTITRKKGGNLMEKEKYRDREGKGRTESSGARTSW